MTRLRDVLERLGMSQYYQPFCDEGFDTWDSVMDITESDMEALGVRLGYRRKLQRVIQEARGNTRDGLSPDQQRQRLTNDESSRGNEAAFRALSASGSKEVDTNQRLPSTMKRRYRRHPKPDEHAPERPPSAYVLFSNQTRDSLRGQGLEELSFTDIAKLVGERWQEQGPEGRHPYESRAQVLKEQYYSQFTEYKKTDEYRKYQDYLAEFKAKHGHHHAITEPKRIKTDHENSLSRRSSSGDMPDGDFDGQASVNGDSRPPSNLSPTSTVCSNLDRSYQPPLAQATLPALRSPGPNKHSFGSMSPTKPMFSRLPPIYLHSEPSDGGNDSADSIPRTLPMHIANAHGTSSSGSTFQGSSTPGIPLESSTSNETASGQSAYSSDKTPSLKREDAQRTSTKSESGSTSGGSPLSTRPSLKYSLSGIDTSNQTPWRSLPLFPGLRRSQPTDVSISPSFGLGHGPNHQHAHPESEVGTLPRSDRGFRSMAGHHHQQQYTYPHISIPRLAEVSESKTPPKDSEFNEPEYSGQEKPNWSKERDRHRIRPHNNLATLLRASEEVDRDPGDGSEPHGHSTPQQ